MIGSPLPQHTMPHTDVSGLEKGMINNPLVSPILRNANRGRVGSWAGSGAGTHETSTLASLTDPHSPAVALLVLLMLLVLWKGRIDLAVRGAAKGSL